MIRIDDITLHMGPHTLGAPDNLENAILEFINAAERSLEVAVQELESRPIAEALIDARRRNVKVRVVLEGDYLIDRDEAEDPFEQGGAHEPNRELLNAMLRSNIDVRTDYNPEIFHQKFVVRDIGVDSSDQRAVLTGSTNFTPTGTHKNLNHVLTIRDGYVAREYAKEFEEIWAGTFGTARARHDPKPRLSRVSGVRVKVLFAPDHAPEMEIMKQMRKARERIDFAIFTFAQSSGIDDAMIALQKAQLPVRGVLDAGQGNRDWAATRPVANAGAELHLASRRNGLGKLHHKLMVIDRKVIIAGSFNYTGPANALNDENIIVIGELGEQRAQGRENQERLATFAGAEIDRIIAAHGMPAEADPTAHDPSLADDG
jgi:phosphatidylserine/phosphatidylglycerophosphate/cardiolipin synthase-like enzyme